MAAIPLSMLTGEVHQGVRHNTRPSRRRSNLLLERFRGQVVDVTYPDPTNSERTLEKMVYVTEDLKIEERIPLDKMGKPQVNRKRKEPEPTSEDELESATDSDTDDDFADGKMSLNYFNRRTKRRSKDDAEDDRECGKEYTQCHFEKDAEAEDDVSESSDESDDEEETSEEEECDDDPVNDDNFVVDDLDSEFSDHEDELESDEDPDPASD